MKITITLTQDQITEISGNYKPKEDVDARNAYNEGIEEAIRTRRDFENQYYREHGKYPRLGKIHDAVRARKIRLPSGRPTPRWFRDDE